MNASCINTQHTCLALEMLNMNLFNVMTEKDLEGCWVLGLKQPAPRHCPSHQVKGIVTPSRYAPCCLDEMFSRNIQQLLFKDGGEV